jgi:hypothetical protein
VEGQSTPQAESIQGLDLVQLYLDPIYELEELDRYIAARRPRQRPGLRASLTKRMHVMRALAAQLHP